MIFSESETIELKEIVTDDIKKEVIAFGNCDGGIIYVGVKRDGTVAGLPDVDGAMQQVSNMVRDSIKPDMTMFIKYSMLEQEGKTVLAIRVQRGTGRPYYIARKGLRPEGVYVRQGTSSAPASDIAIRRMIRETDGESFEDMRSLNQALTFTNAEEEFQNRNVDFGDLQKQTLQLVTAEGIYTNLALLLSDQCTHTTKAAVFQGKDQSIFKDRREFTGSILKQMNEAYEYIDLNNRTRSTFDGLHRNDSKAYPQAAVREALLNSLVHRDYGFAASTLISIYDDRIEIVSIGGLVPGISLEDVMMGLSVCRNPQLANVFYRLELIEAYGTGMRKIIGAYEGSDQRPLIETTANAFKIVLPNLHRREEVLRVEEGHLSAAYFAVHDDMHENLLSRLEPGKTIRRQDIQRVMGISQTTAGRILRKLVEDGSLIKVGGGRSTRYYKP